MGELLANPAVQSGIAPFVVALAMAFALHRTRLLVLSIAAAFAITVALTAGFDFDPLTGTRKLILVGLVACVLAAVFAVSGMAATARVRISLAVAGAVAAVWIVWRILHQQELQAAALWGLGSAALAALLIGSSLRSDCDPLCDCANSLVLGLTAGALALMGSSALLGQFGIALAAGSGAALLVQMVASRAAAAGWTLALPAAVIVAGLGLQSVLTGSLPWYSLIPLLAIPWAARTARSQARPPWLVAVVAVCAASIPMLAAIALTWAVARPAS